jgi:hypothetical protein
VKTWLVPAFLTSVCCAMQADAKAVTATIENDQLSAIIQLPDARNGYYRGTRFDWSGVVSSLRFRGHELVNPWSQANDPSVSDYEYRGDKVVTGPNTTMVGLPEEFGSLPTRTSFGFEDAKVGGTFVKIGVGILRKPDDKPYDHFRSYDIVGGNRWEVSKTANSVTFTQTVNDGASGYGYVYSKKLTIARGKAELIVEHTLRNTGRLPITGMVYDHNFTRWDNEPPGSDYSVRFSFDVKPAEPLGDMPLQFAGHAVHLTRALGQKESMRALPSGFGTSAGDYDFRIENSKLNLGLRITADQPVSRAALWGIRTVFAIEPFINYDIASGSQFQWKYTYAPYVLTEK